MKKTYYTVVVVLFIVKSIKIICIKILFPGKKISELMWTGHNSCLNPRQSLVLVYSNDLEDLIFTGKINNNLLVHVMSILFVGDKYWCRITAQISMQQVQ